MPSVAYNGYRRRIEVPLSEIIIEAEDGETASLFVRWADRDKVWALVDSCVDKCLRDGDGARWDGEKTINSSEGA